MKSIPVATKILMADGKPYRIPERAEDSGEIIWADDNNGKPIVNGQVVGKPRMKYADTLTLVEAVLANIPRDIQGAKDHIRVPQLWHRVSEARDKMDEQAKVKGDDGPGLAHIPSPVPLEIHDKVYEWLHGLLRREIPLTPEQKQAENVNKIIYAVGLWGTTNAALFIEELRPPDERKKIDDLEMD